MNYKFLLTVLLMLSALNICFAQKRVDKTTGLMFIYNNGEATITGIDSIHRPLTGSLVIPSTVTDDEAHILL